MRNLPISKYSNEKVGIGLLRDGSYLDADGDVTATISDSEGVASAPITASADGTGLYSVRIPTDVSSAKGVYTVKWTYDVDSEAREYDTAFEVVDPMPFWDTLDSAERQAALNVYHKVSDTFDSTEGGPYLWELYQTSFNAFETTARLMSTDALAYINFTGQPAFIPPYQVGGSASKKYPVAWHGLLERATYIELASHLSRSYLEIPDPQGITTARLDRQKYRAEWKAEADAEREILDKMLIQFKRKFLGGSRKRALLLQGIAGNHFYVNPTRPYWNYSVARI